MKLEDRLKSLGTGLAVAASAALFLGIDVNNTFWSSREWLRYSIASALLVLFCLSILGDWLLKNYRRLIMRKRNLSGIVVSKKISIIDIQDEEGQKATFFHKAHFLKVKGGSYVAQVIADTSVPTSFINVDQLQLANCTAKFDSSKKEVHVHFTNNIENLNKSKSLYPVEKYFYFSTEMINCFTHREEDSWGINTYSYTKEYELHINFPPQRKIEQVRMYKKEQEKEILITAACPIIIKKQGYDSIFLLITNFDQLDRYIIKWSYKKV
jgi:hypothetical protein